MSPIIAALIACLTCLGQGDSLEARRTPVVDVFRSTRDVVVNISTTQVRTYRSSIFDEIFELPGRQFTSTSVGSGFVIHEDGYIVTNAHVVSQSTQCQVVFANKHTYEAYVVALDQEHDLAVLKIEPKENLRAIKLGTSSDLMIGETVIAIGNPFGYQHTVTTGVVSALHRDLKFDNGITYQDLIQTDAGINPGNSGGPLLNVLGELVGINTAIRGDAENMAFAIPVDQLVMLMPEMLDTEKLHHAYVGLKVSGTQGALVKYVVPRSPADRAGLRRGDVLQSIDGQPIRQGFDYAVKMVTHQPGDSVRLTVDRRGRKKDFRLTIEHQPKPEGAQLARKTFGLQLEPIDPDVARKLDIEPDAGLFVTGIVRGSPADLAGIAPGDLLVQLGRYHVCKLDTVGRLLDTLQPGDRVYASFWRYEQGRFHRYDARLRAR